MAHGKHILGRYKKEKEKLLPQEKKQKQYMQQKQKELAFMLMDTRVKKMMTLYIMITRVINTYESYR
ncbi:unnamed protein product [Brassica napus]|uniref:(rape) hypothetical protein n=1 Tax=Brassica napus TaxID=3708 RepID=A0A817AZG6_BRANA|nr:unnamed protein product [Brassica napus]